MFFYNRRDGRTQWERPKELAEEKDKAEATVALQVRPQMARGAWKPIVDENSGRTYYYNTVTGESRWTDPNEAPKDAEQKKKSMWKQIIDEITGRIMFYNAKTMEKTSWQGSFGCARCTEGSNHKRGISREEHVANASRSDQRPTLLLQRADGKVSVDAACWYGRAS